MTAPVAVGGTGLAQRAGTVWRRNSELDLGGLAAGAAFWLLLSVFPAGLVAVNVFGLFVDQEEIARSIGALATETPGTWGELLAQQLQEVAAPTPGTGGYDAVLVVFALWTVSNAMLALLRAIRRVYGVPPTGHLLVRAVASGIGVVVIIVVAVLAESIDAATLFGSILGVLATAVVLFAMLLGLLRTAVGRSRSWRELVPGAAGAAIGLLLVGAALNVYAAFSPNLTLVYGRIAGVVVSMLTVWLGVYVVLLGAVINTVVNPEDSDE